jgi:hypothetical protein
MRCCAAEQEFPGVLKGGGAFTFNSQVVHE